MFLLWEFRGAKEAEKLTSKVDSLAEQFLRSTGATLHPIGSPPFDGSIKHRCRSSSPLVTNPLRTTACPHVRRPHSTTAPPAALLLAFLPSINCCACFRKGGWRMRPRRRWTGRGSSPRRPSSPSSASRARSGRRRARPHRILAAAEARRGAAECGVCCGVGVL